MRVALITVGDELLAGDTVNTNAAWLAEQLTDRGVDVDRITVVPDRRADIAETVDAYRTQYDAVLVTGGIGPTHDDVTMDAVAEAFDVALVEDQAALDWLADHRDYAREDLADGTAAIPAGARMIPNHEGVAPGCVLANVYVLPGVPEEMKAMFGVVNADFAGEQQHVEVIHVDEPESALLDRIETLSERFDVTVGSYPGETVRIKISSPDQTAVERATAWLRDRVELSATE
ncbi:MULTISPECIES: molybdopterin-binding protein [unclassified Halorhabdus]|uniref:competence/damage-inducible protein A n=1 Tax=unclassified Halorhabdus TaxID=2621901 RepID=UPI0023DAE558|nr:MULTISPECIES: molybdopterin-binding protein [unclassified Halorhabdus]WEL17466.1 Competence/damage-inducible protein A [Halorhabdus sp. SVX81]WEL21344.1 Competence/damage-inducible protein A [Halorhabdus sp. BNX81]